jgi:lipopolysaccharide transport system permease protein
MEERIIEAGQTEKHYWQDLWHFRELLFFLAWRDILVRYKQTAIGLSWAVIRPLITLIVFTVVFGRIAKLPAPGEVPYSLLVCAGLLPWQCFATTLGESSNSLVGNANLISKVYFPRLIVPAAVSLTSLVDFLITLALMGIILLWYGFTPDWRVLMLPLFAGLGFCAAFGGGLWMCALTARYRDFRFVVPFLVQLGIYASPVGFSSSIVPADYRVLYSLNPMVGAIDGFRWSLLRGRSPVDWLEVALASCVAVLTCTSGLRYFRRAERQLADIL